METSKITPDFDDRKRANVFRFLLAVIFFFLISLQYQGTILEMNNCNIFLVFEVFTIQLTFELFILN